MSSQPGATLPLERVSRLENFGHSLQRAGYVYQPSHIDEVHKLFELSRKQGTSIALRGAGRSYGDASLNSGQIVLDLRGLNKILEWNPENGRIRTEPGVTIEQLWKHVLADGWWPPVVPGTMFPTIGGCLAANIHGKNNWQAGPLGEHILEFEALLPNGKAFKCSPSVNTDYFYALISGMGLLGIFTSITLQLKKIYSGDMRVTAWTEPNLQEMLKAVDANKDADYVVGWVDCTVGGGGLGRGQVHRAEYPKEGEDRHAEKSLRVDHQVLPTKFFGLVPKELLPVFMAPFTNNFGTWAVNQAKYIANSTIGIGHAYQQPLVGFNFLLDYIPNWERIYGGGGLIQHQSFLPKENAGHAHLEMLRLCRKRGLPSYLGVLKRHRPDKFLFSHAVDGYSLALDFRVTRDNHRRLTKMVAELDEIVLQAGGRFYFAKDSTLSAETVQRYLGKETISKFKKLKAEVDPDNLLQSDLYRRCFAA